MDLAVMRHVNNVVRRSPCSACPPARVSLVGKIEGGGEKKSGDDRVDGDPLAEVMEV